MYRNVVRLNIIAICHLCTNFLWNICRKKTPMNCLLKTYKRRLMTKRYVFFYIWFKLSWKAKLGRAYSAHILFLCNYMEWIPAVIVLYGSHSQNNSTKTYWKLWGISQNSTFLSHVHSHYQKECLISFPMIPDTSIWRLVMIPDTTWWRSSIWSRKRLLTDFMKPWLWDEQTCKLTF